MPDKKRAVLTTGGSVLNIKRGPERHKSETKQLQKDKEKLEQAYPPHKATILNEGDGNYGGDTDEIFDED
ncbi:hypothetical protein PZB74_10640 [Porifericola rhodea]|uniref:hypothetical protein n=1 Tax=Porifericola rhodea TaxID=930972 RepID=UPI002665690D|nr:hypothetical protein [Porifericola rhodea]WKN33781.1 hypothetical protein PZB74_10640 [Porifericola rhodea]